MSLDDTVNGASEPASDIGVVATERVPGLEWSRVREHGFLRTDEHAAQLPVSGRLLDWLEALQARRAPGGVRFLRSFAQVTEELEFATCADLAARAGQHLLNSGLRPGDRVVLVFESCSSSLLGFFALLWIGAVPLSVRGPGFGDKRQYAGYLDAVAAQYGARFVVAPDAVLVSSSEGGSQLTPLHVRAQLTAPAKRVAAEEDDVAFVQFSSGSTSAPKGVVITHGILSRNLQAIAQQEGRKPGDRGSLWLPLFHDMGLIGVLSGFLDGTGGFVAPPSDFLIDPLEWLLHLSRERVTVIAVPNFAIEYTLRALENAAPEDLAALDLSHLRTVFLGSEVINVAAVERWAERLRPFGLSPLALKPCYGMAEAVLMVTCVRPAPLLAAHVTARGDRVACLGKPAADFELKIVDEAGAELAEGETGELWLRGGTVSPRYLDDRAALRDADGWYHTGDVAFLRAGELFVLGRTGDRIKINAESYYATDLEHCALELPFIEPGRVAFIQCEKEVYCLVEFSRKLDQVADWATQLTQHVKNYGVHLKPEQVVVVPRGHLEKTSSGKLRRRRLAEALRDGTLVRFVRRQPAATPSA